MRTMIELAAMQPPELAATLRETLTELENIVAVLERRGWNVYILKDNGYPIGLPLSAEIKRTVTMEETL